MAEKKITPSTKLFNKSNQTSVGFKRKLL